MSTNRRLIRLPVNRDVDATGKAMDGSEPRVESPDCRNVPAEGIKSPSRAKIERKKERK